MSYFGRVGQRTHHFTEAIGKGGEATVFRHPTDRTLAARIYHDPATMELTRIQQMLSKEPTPSMERGFPCFGWPVDIITEPKTGHIIGTVIRYAAEAVPLSLVLNPGYRLSQISSHWLWCAAKSLAFRAYSADWHEFLIADCNPENFLVDRHGLVCAVDCESYQFTLPAGKTYQCGVGVPTLTAPELLTASGPATATRQSVAWSVMVLIHMLLRDGEHPFNSANTTPRLVARITQGLWPDSGKFVAYPPPTRARPFALLPSEFQALCIRTFGDGHAQPSARPSLGEILDVLDRNGATSVAISRSAWIKQLPSPQPANPARHVPKMPQLTRPRVRELIAVGVMCATGAALFTSAHLPQVATPSVLDEPATREFVTPSSPGVNKPTPRLWQQLRESP